MPVETQGNINRLVTVEGENDAGTQPVLIVDVDDGHEQPVQALAKVCESNFANSLALMVEIKETRFADILQRLQSRFVNWAGYLGVFAMESASLDRRLKHNQQYRDLVLLVLNMLNSRLLQTLAKVDDIESEDSSSDDEPNRREVEVSSIITSLNELDRLAIIIRQPSASALDARVSAFGARKQSEVASFKTLATVSVDSLYPKASEMIRQRLIRSLTHQCTRLLYWTFHDKKLRTDSRHHGQSVGSSDGDELKTQPVHTAVRPYQQKQRTVKFVLDEPKPISRNAGASVSRLSETVPSQMGSRLVPLRTVNPMLQEKRPTATTTVLQSGGRFPTPPKVENGGDQHSPCCPLCRKLFSCEDFANVGWWRKHVNSDLFPFVCLLSTCPESPVYASRSEWIDHMIREHGCFWSLQCNTSTDPESEHVQTEASPISGSCPGEDVCPLCSYRPLGNKSQPSGGTESATEVIGVVDRGPLPDTEKAMLDHIAGHLQFLGLLAPRLLAEKPESGEIHEFASSQAVTRENMSENRTTLDNLSEFSSEGRHSATDGNHPPQPESMELSLEIFSRGSELDIWNGVIRNSEPPEQDDFLQKAISSGAFQPQQVKLTLGPIALSDGNKELMENFHVTSPRGDKTRLDNTERLGADSWILHNPDFQRWCSDPAFSLLSIKSNFYCNMSMMTRGIIGELGRIASLENYGGHLAYFFCQSDDKDANNATAMLRGLMYLLINQQPSLLQHLLKRQDGINQYRLYGLNTWAMFSEIFDEMLRDPSLLSTFIVIDAIDECITGHRQLLDFISHTAVSAKHVKWLVMSHRESATEEDLFNLLADKQAMLSIEIHSAREALSLNSKYDRHVEILQLLALGSVRDGISYDWFKDRVKDHAHGSLNWFLNHRKFRRWSSLESGLLLVSADPGSGKSVLAKYLVDHELQHQASTQRAAIICYHFFTTTDKNPVNETLCALLHQMFSQKPVLLRHAVKPLDGITSDSSLSQKLLWTIFGDAVRDRQEGPTMIVLDGLDEYTGRDSDHFVSSLSSLFFNDQSRTAKLKVLLTSRTKDISNRLSGLPIRSPYLHISREEVSEAISQEIELCIRNGLERLSKEDRLTHENKSYLEEKLLRIKDRSYVPSCLIFDELGKRFEISPNEVLADIRSTSSSLNALYEQYLDQSRDVIMVRKVISIILAATRPLTVLEMNIAMHIYGKEESFPDIIDAESEDRIRNLCGPLISMNDNKVQFTSQSIRDFLLGPGTVSADQQWQHSFTTSQAHSILAEICVYYLNIYNFDEVGEQMSSDNNGGAFLNYSASNWGFHFHKADFPYDSPVVSVASRLCYRHSRCHQIWSRIYCKTTELDLAGLFVVSYFGLDSIAKLLVNQGADVDITDNKLRTPLLYAILSEHESMVYFLIDSGACVNTTDESARTPLVYAVRIGNESIARLLLERGATIHGKDIFGLRPLLHAVEGGYKEMVQLLISFGADIKARDKSGRTLLMYAVEGGDKEMVQLLISFGADIEARDVSGRTLLMYAVEGGDKEMVQLLISFGADIKARDELGCTPLTHAVKRGDKEMVQLLISFGADIEARDKSGRTLLMHAVKRGDKEMVQLLISFGADIEARDKSGRTLLMYALTFSNDAMAELLIHLGAIETEGVY